MDCLICGTEEIGRMHYQDAHGIRLNQHGAKAGGYYRCNYCGKSFPNQKFPLHLVREHGPRIALAPALVPAAANLASLIRSDIAASEGSEGDTILTTELFNYMAKKIVSLEDRLREARKQLDHAQDLTDKQAKGKLSEELGRVYEDFTKGR